MTQIPITDLVQEELRKRKDYDTVRGKMEENLARPDKVKRYATHESGHLLYLIKTGLFGLVPSYEQETTVKTWELINFSLAAIRLTAPLGFMLPMEDHVGT